MWAAVSRLVQDDYCHVSLVDIQYLNVGVAAIRYACDRRVLLINSSCHYELGTLDALFAGTCTRAPSGMSEGNSILVTLCKQGDLPTII